MFPGSPASTLPTLHSRVPKRQRRPPGREYHPLEFSLFSRAIRFQDTGEIASCHLLSHCCPRLQARCTLETAERGQQVLPDLAADMLGFIADTTRC